MFKSLEKMNEMNIFFFRFNSFKLSENQSNLFLNNILYDITKP